MEIENVDDHGEGIGEGRRSCSKKLEREVGASWSKKLEQEVGARSWSEKLIQEVEHEEEKKEGRGKTIRCRRWRRHIHV